MMDLAIVGGGLAGAYVAHRTSQLRPDWSIALLESCDRVGGRLLSVRMPGTTDTVIELGCMPAGKAGVLLHGYLFLYTPALTGRDFLRLSRVCATQRVPGI